MTLHYNLSQIDSISQQILAHSKGKPILFYGEMGTGKTTLISSMLKVLGITDINGSPTFSIVNEYITKKDEKIYHFDFYRINKEEEALDIGFEEYLYEGDWIFIEWPEKISSFLPEDSLKIKLTIKNELERECVIS